MKRSERTSAESPKTLAHSPVRGKAREELATPTARRAQAARWAGLLLISSLLDHHHGMRLLSSVHANALTPCAGAVLSSPALIFLVLYEEEGTAPVTEEELPLLLLLLLRLLGGGTPAPGQSCCCCCAAEDLLPVE